MLLCDPPEEDCCSLVDMLCTFLPLFFPFFRHILQNAFLHPPISSHPKVWLICHIVRANVLDSPLLRSHLFHSCSFCASPCRAIPYSCAGCSPSNSRGTLHLLSISVYSVGSPGGLPFPNFAVMCGGPVLGHTHVPTVL